MQLPGYSIKSQNISILNSQKIKFDRLLKTRKGIYTDQQDKPQPERNVKHYKRNE